MEVFLREFWSWQGGIAEEQMAVFVALGQLVLERIKMIQCRDKAVLWYDVGYVAYRGLIAINPFVKPKTLKNTFQ